MLIYRVADGINYWNQLTNSMLLQVIWIQLGFLALGNIFNALCFLSRANLFSSNVHNSNYQFLRFVRHRKYRSLTIFVWLIIRTVHLISYYCVMTRCNWLHSSINWTLKINWLSLFHWAKILLIKWPAMARIKTTFNLDNTI